MRLWELASVCRSELHLMERLSANPEWAVYLDWYRNIDRLVRAQDRAKLDAELPDAAAIHVLSGSTARFYLSGGYIRVRSVDPSDRTLSAVDVLRLYGSGFLEDMLEAGLAPVPN